MQTVLMDVDFANEKIDRIPAGYIDKTICGCGMTTVAIENDIDTIIAVPRINLINNKCVQYPNERSAVRILSVTGKTKRQEIDEYVSTAKPIKVMVTYDSLPKVEHLLEQCHLVIDESNMLLSDSKYKKDVTATVLEIAEKYKNTVSFVSATPIPLDFMPAWVKELNQIKYIWTSTRKSIPLLCKRRSPVTALKEEFMQPLLKHNVHTVQNYTFGKLLIFLNNVDEIISIVKELKIPKTDCSIICGDNLRNDVRIKGIPRFIFGNELPKFTFVTSSGFQGIDLYDDTVMTVIVSNSSQEFQMLDMATDLKQAVSRQRRKTNPNYGTYVFLYNQAFFEVTETELIKKMDRTKEIVLHNIDKHEEYKTKHQAHLFIYNSIFEKYTYYKNGSFNFAEMSFNADRYFIIETRRQYERGFNYAVKMDDSVVIEPPKDGVTDITYANLVKYFDANHVDGKCDWGDYSDKRKWISTINDCYLYYGRTWSNYTTARQKLELYGDCYEQIKDEIRNSFSVKKRYTAKEVTETLKKIYKLFSINRVPKISDVGMVFKWTMKTVHGYRMIDIVSYT